jgi:hypothetical protein
MVEVWLSRNVGVCEAPAGGTFGGSTGLKWWSSAGIDGQAGLSQSPVRAVGVVTVRGIVCGNKTLFLMLLLLIFDTLLFVFCLFVEKLYSVFDGGAPRTALLGLLPPGL